MPILAICSLDAAAQAVPPEFQVNTTTANWQYESDVSATADGGFIVAWHDGGLLTAKAQRFTATATKVGAEITVPDATGTMPFTSYIGPHVTGLVDGGAVVVWTGNEDGVADPESISGVAAQIFDGNGVKLGSQFHVNTTTAGRQTVGGVAPLANGGFVVVWESAPAPGTTGQDGSGRGVYARRFNADGSPASGEFRVNALTTDDQKAPSVSPLANGGFVVVYMDNGAPAFKAQRYSSTGSTVGGEIIIGGTEQFTAVAGLKDGGFVAAWMAAGGGVGTECYARQFDANGAAVTGTFTANTYNADAQQCFGIAGLANGGYVILWASYQQDGSQLGVYGQKFTAAGVKDDVEFRVNVKTDDVQTSSAVAALGNGFVATWSSNAQDGSDYGIFGRLFGDTGTGGGSVITGTSEPDNLTGTTGADTIDGKSGADIMKGLAGDDTYIVDNAGDSVVESPGEGTDLVKSSVTYALPANVENLALTRTSPINGTGNGLNNKLIGNEGNNSLDGRVGADTMGGRGGDDVYFVDNVADRVVELVDGGIDTVRSTVSHTLPENVENLVLTGTAATNGTGNGQANRIAGNAANNVLNGGAGNDTLTGGGGQDRFVFKTALNQSTNVDRVQDFVPIDDQIRLDHRIFTAFPSTGMLSTSMFRSGSAATTSAQRIVYNPASGLVFYDADGSGPIVAIRFARLATGLTLTNKNFVVQ